MNTITITKPEFSNIYLSKQIPVFNDLNTLESCKFLKFNNVNKIGTTNAYKVIHYEKEFLSSDLISSYGLCRSIIVNSKNEVICYAPPKSIPADSFMEKYSIRNLFVVAEEFVEGTMINVFWDKTNGINGTWEIATRNIVGATSSFFIKKNRKSFREMFFEACEECNLLLDELNKNYCYSFVLQHPENRIVVPFKKPNLYLVSVFLIENSNSDVVIHNMHLDRIKRDNDLLLHHLGIQNSMICFPQKINTDSTTYSDLIEKYGSINTSYDVLGIVLYNKNTGERTKIRNPVYEEVRQLRGNQPKLQYQYLSLRHQGKIAEFLKYYPESKRECSEFRHQLHLFTNNLFANYILCYIKKEKPLKEYPEQYRTHMFHLHKIYLNDLKEKNLFVTNTIVKKYVNEMPPSLLMYSLNFHLRKRNIEEVYCE